MGKYYKYIVRKLFLTLGLFSFNFSLGQMFFTENFDFFDFQTFKEISLSQERWTFFHTENQDFNNNRIIDDWEDIKSVEIVNIGDDSVIRFELNRMEDEILMIDVMKKGEIDGEKVDYLDFFNHVNRAEISTFDYPNSTSYSPNRKYKFYFSNLIPEDYEFETKNCNNPKDSNYDIMGQWHFTNSVRQKTKPPLSLRLVCDIWYLTILRENYASEENYHFIPISKAEKGKWINWEVNFRLSHKKRGFIEVYKDGKQLYSEKKVKNIESKRIGGVTADFYFKIGIYKPHWWSRDTDVAQRVVYFDNVRVSR